MTRTFITVGVLLLLVALGAYIYTAFFSAEPEYVDASSTLEGVKVQPQAALDSAEPYLEEHATVVFNDDPLKDHIVTYKGWYHIMRTNYPAKTFRYYLSPAVRVNMETGEVVLPETK